MLVLLPYQAGACVYAGNNNKDSNDGECYQVTVFPEQCLEAAAMEI